MRAGQVLPARCRDVRSWQLWGAVLADKLPDLVGRIERECRGGGGSAGGVVEPADGGADLIEGGGRDGEDVAVQPDEQGQHEGVRGGVAADGYLPAVQVGSGDGVGDGAQ